MSSQVTADYPLAAWVPAAASAFRHVSGTRKITHIALHVTDGHERAEGTAEMFATPGQRTSAHYVIGQDAKVIQCVRDNDVAEHAHTANAYSIGIEHCARTPGEPGAHDPGLPLTEPQIRASVALVQALCARYAIPLDSDHVQGHSTIDPATTHTGCPQKVAGGFPFPRWLPL